MLDVYRAIDEPPLFSLRIAEDTPGCLVEQAVNAALDSELAAARERLLRRFGEITLAALASDFEQRWRAPSKRTARA